MVEARCQSSVIATESLEVRCTSLDSGCQRDETESVDQNLFLSHRHVLPRECFNQSMLMSVEKARLAATSFCRLLLFH